MSDCPEPFTIYRFVKILATELTPIGASAIGPSVSIHNGLALLAAEHCGDCHGEEKQIP